MAGIECETRVAPTATGTAATGQIPGTTTNDAASAGSIGQILTNSATAVSVSTGVGKTITSQSLTAGDWDVWCVFKFNVASGTTVTVLAGEVSPTDNSVPATLGNYFEVNSNTAFVTGTATNVYSTPTVPLSLAGATTYYCTTIDVFAVSTLTADAKLVARRRR